MTLITPQTAESKILSDFPSAPIESVSIDQAFGRTLRSTVHADRAIPPYDRVMMDGVGIELSKGGVAQSHYEIVGSQAAGSAPQTIESTGHCIEVMTGAVTPIGVSCVIPIESIEIASKDGARIAKVMNAERLKCGDFIHRIGSDSAHGSPIIMEGNVLGVPELATASSVGKSHLEVSKQPIITLLTSGDEVIATDQSPQPYQIRASHPIAIHSSIESQKLGTVKHHHLADDPKLIEQSVHAALTSSDILILTGGVSKGKFDFIAPILRKLCGPACFHGVSQRPGKPFAYHKHPIPIFALPGNPLSVMACLARYVLPALRQYAMQTTLKERFMVGACINGQSNLTQLLSSKIINAQAIPSTPKNSGEYTAIHGCSGVIEIPPNCGSVENLNSVPFYPW